MKKLILGLAVISSSFALAQTANTSSSPVRFGIKAGMNVASISKDNTLDDQKSKIGFNAGVFANIPIASSFSVQPEVLYSQYGSKANYTMAGNKYSASSNLDYVTVPVMLQYNFIPNFYIEAGPEFGLMVSAKNKVKNETNGNSSTTDNYKDELNTFNFGIGLGLGYYFTDNIGVTARYVAGVTDIAKDRASNSDAVKNNVFQVGLAYKF